MFETLKSMGKHFVVYGLGRILGRMVGFIMLPIYLHHLTVEEYGSLDLLDLTTYIVGMFMAGGISHAVMRFYYDTEDPAEQKLIVSTAMISIWTLCIFFLVWLLLFANEISMFIFESNEFASLFKLIFISTVIALTNEVPLSFIRAQQKSTLFTIISLTQLVIGLSLNILFIVGFGWGIEGIIISGLTASSVAGLFLGVYSFRYSGFGFSIFRAKQMFRYGLPLIPAGVGYFLLNYADRLFLQRFTDLTQVGLYALAYKFGMLVSPSVTEPFLSIYRPMMFEIAQRDRQEAKLFVAVVLTYMIFLTMFMVLGISVLIKDGLVIIGSTEFHSAYKVVPLIGTAYVLMGAYMVVQIGILIEKKTKYLAYMVLTTASLNLIMNYFLVPLYGAWGAAIATVGSFFALFLMNWRISNRLFSIRIEWVRLFKIVVVATGLYFICYYVTIEEIYMSLAVKFLIALSFPLVLFVFRFYTPVELSKAREILGKYVARIKE